MNVFNFFDNIVCQFKIFLGVLENIFTNFLKVELFFDDVENVTDHELNAQAHQVKVIVFVELIPAMKNVIDHLCIFTRVANIIPDDPRLIHQKVMIHENVLGSEVKSISPKVIQLINIDPISFVANYLKLPFSFSNRFTFN